MTVTRVFRRRSERQVREDELGPDNQATRIASSPLRSPALEPVSSGPFDARALFIRRYDFIRRALERHRKQGLVILAFDASEEPVCEGWLAASLDRARGLIVGRHSMCQVAVPPRHAAVSLRHLAVVVRAVSHTEVSVRVLDLHTPTGFSDEAGRVLQAVSSEGSFFLRIGDVTLMLLATDEDPVPARAEDAYACIPPRVFLDERSGTVGDPAPRYAYPGAVGAHKLLDHRRGDGSTSVVSQVGPLAAAGLLCSEDETALGTLIVRTEGGVTRRTVGGSMLDRGLLVGRYARCAVGLNDEANSRLSRVHLLLVREGDDLLALDTASVNGTFVGDRAVQLTDLEEGLTLDLGGELSLTWHFAQ